MTRIDPALEAHKDWIGFVQPVGLVVSAQALVAAQVELDKNVVPQQQALLGLVSADQGRIFDFERFTVEVLGWRDGDLISGDQLEALAVSLPDFGETLRPSYSVKDPDGSDKWLLLGNEVPSGENLDDEKVSSEKSWRASHQARFERLLRETGVPIGILTNGDVVRLVYAPRGESTGHITFVVHQMCEVAGRRILAALWMLLRQEQLFAAPTSQRLPTLLAQSRKYQSEVSERLAEQVLGSLWELLRGFQAADEFNHGDLLRDVLRQAPNDVYGGLLATLMRLVFSLYAEDRGMLPTKDGLYASNYSVLGLFESLREDDARYHDSMDQRYGAWARLLTLFRLLYDGGAHATFRVPARQGRLFDPDVYPFLEGRPYNSKRSPIAESNIPRLSDGVVYRILTNLLYLDGERLSYSALDVEEIGSVYEAMMGFRLEVVKGPSIGVRPKTKKGIRADVIINLLEILDAKTGERPKLLKETAGAEITGRSIEALKSATTVEQVIAALGTKISPFTPRTIPKGAMALQPSEERRRSGSHYTPRSLTQPIVKTTLQPILDQLCGDPECAAFEVRNDPNRREPVPGCIEQGEVRNHLHPRPEQILDLKVCDPAMGSGAFLVEACRFLGEGLVRAWQLHGGVPPIPPDEDIVLYARRRIAQKCLYGVDRNSFAVDLAKLSLWLATLAKNHPFTFLDHALRHGDSLVGLSRDQIIHFDWDESDQFVLELSDALRAALTKAEDKRSSIHELADSDNVAEKQRLLDEAEQATRLVRTAGDLLIAAFFGAEKDRDRKALRASTLEALRGALRSGQDINDSLAVALRAGDKPLPPFHWFLEFPEVFSRPNAGFDSFIGNPPFAGKNTLIKSNRDSYPAWLKVLHEETHGNADLIAQFFRRAFTLTRQSGTFGLIATNTIAQGDTRGSGLRWICKHGGSIYEARKRVKWPGSAAVVVSVLHVRKGDALKKPRLDGRVVDRITAFLFHAGGHDDPLPLRENAGKSFIGSYVLGMGFTFDDDNEDATPIAEMRKLVAKSPKNAERIFPYIGGEEVNESPTHAHRRYVINFGDMSEQDARAGWPDLMEIIEQKVKPSRSTDNRDSYRVKWWQFAEKRKELYEVTRNFESLLVASQTSKHLAFAFVPTPVVPSHKLVVFALVGLSGFAQVQSRPHEYWARILGSTMKDDPVYTPSDCFENFPFADDSGALSGIGAEYYRTRASYMVVNNEGITTTYNRFHDPNERRPAILNLRELHDAMDRAVLDAYGWTDIRPRCQFIAEHENEEVAETSSRRTRSWRYRWPDDVRDEVLARLLALNAERAKSQKAISSTTELKDGKDRPKKRETPLFNT